MRVRVVEFSLYRVGGADSDARSRAVVRRFDDRSVRRVIEWVRAGCVPAPGGPVTVEAGVERGRVMAGLRATARDAAHVHVVRPVRVLHRRAGRVRVDRAVRVIL